MTAIACATERVRIGPLVTPTPRRRIHEARARDGHARPPERRPARARRRHRRRPPRRVRARSATRPTRASGRGCSTRASSGSWSCGAASSRPRPRRSRGSRSGSRRAGPTAGRCAAPRAGTASSRSTCRAPRRSPSWRREVRELRARRRGPVRHRRDEPGRHRSGAVGAGGRDLVPDRLRRAIRPRPRCARRSTRGRDPDALDHRLREAVAGRARRGARGARVSSACSTSACGRSRGGRACRRPSSPEARRARDRVRAPARARHADRHPSGCSAPGIWTRRAPRIGRTSRRTRSSTRWPRSSTAGRARLLCLEANPAGCHRRVVAELLRGAAAGVDGGGSVGVRGGAVERQRRLGGRWSLDGCSRSAHVSCAVWPPRRPRSSRPAPLPTQRS